MKILKVSFHHQELCIVSYFLLMCGVKYKDAEKSNFLLTALR